MKVHVPSCVVLVINDNLYGLMFALRYLYRSCPWEKIGVHVLDSRRVYDDQGSIQGFIYEEWSCVEMSLLQEWLGKED